MITAPEYPQYVKPNLEGIPETLLLSQEHIFCGWRLELNEAGTKYRKPPVLNKGYNDPDKMRPLLDIVSQLQNGQGVAMVHDASHPYITLDFDGVPRDHPRVVAFLEAHPTYVETSPSGGDDRYHVIYELPSEQDKALLPDKGFDQVDDAQIELFNKSKNYCTLTGQGNGHPISIITVQELQKHWMGFIPRVVDIKGNAFNAPQVAPIELKTWRDTVPCDRDHPKVRQIIGQMELGSYYEYWRTGLCCIFRKDNTLMGLQEAHEWSKKDAEYDENAVNEKWEYISQYPDEGITVSTYMAFFKHFTIEWPLQEKGKMPSIAESAYRNYKAFLSYLGLELKIDKITHTVYFDGEDAALYPHFYANKREAYSIRDADIMRLSARLFHKCQEYNWTPLYRTLGNWIDLDIANMTENQHTCRLAKEVDKIKWDGVDRIKIISQDILTRHPDHEHPTQDFVDVMMRKFILGMGARAFWPELMPQFNNQGGEGMLVFSGPESIGKSSFIRELLPKDFQASYYVEAVPNFAGTNKDYKLITCTKAIVDYDEVERIISYKDQAAVKQELTAKDDTFRAPYDRHSRTFKRKYSVFASTNKKNLAIPDEGARRFWWVNLRSIDLQKLWKMDRYQLWAQVKQELIQYKDRLAPWILTNKEREYLASYLVTHRSESTHTISLKDVYDHSRYNEHIKGLQDKGSTALEATMSVKDINQEVQHAHGNAGMKIPLAAIREFAKIYFPKRSVRIGVKRTEIKEGYYGNHGGQHRFLMPPLRSEEELNAKEKR